MTRTWDCMTEAELAHWREQAEYVRQTWRKLNIDDPCVDCLVSFSDEMRAIGRCNGTPGEPQVAAPPLPITVGRRETNRLAAQRWRERNPGRRRAFGGSLG